MTAYVIDALRTPIGKYGGSLATVRPDDLLAHVIKSLMERNPGIDVNAIEDVIAGAANQSGEDNRKLGGQIHQIMHPRLHHEYFRSNPAMDEAMEASFDLIGRPGLKFIFDMLIDKPPLTDKATPWHQDEAYAQIPFLPAGTKIQNMGVQFWIALDDVDVENGCMQFISGSHKLDIVDHQSINNDPRIHGLELAPTAGVHVEFPTICPLAAGGATIHPGRTLHYTAPNNSDRPRRALIMGFAAPVKKRADLDLPTRRFPWNEIKRTARDARAAAAREAQN